VRIVLDTNIVVSALLWRGAAYRLFELIRQQERAQLFASSAMLVELGEVLTRSAHSNRLALIGRSAREVLAGYAAAVELVIPAEIPSVITADPDDDEVLAAAAGADIIVTGDRHLLAVGRHENILIVEAAEATRLLTQPS
jgi:putative PIN family toxin of toxin-antitoxin system